MIAMGMRIMHFDTITWLCTCCNKVYMIDYTCRSHQWSGAHRPPQKRPGSMTKQSMPWSTCGGPSCSTHHGPWTLQIKIHCTCLFRNKSLSAHDLSTNLHYTRYIFLLLKHLQPKYVLFHVNSHLVWEKSILHLGSLDHNCLLLTVLASNKIMS